MKKSEQQFCSPGVMPCTAQCDSCAERSLRIYREMQARDAAAAAESWTRLTPDDTEGGEA